MMTNKETLNSHHLMPTTIGTDADVIKRAFGGRLCSLALFGSCVRAGFGNARDIDIVLIMNSVSVDEAKRTLCDLELSYPLRSANIEESYSGGGGFLPQKEYHIVILNPETRCHQFLKRHRGFMIYM
jgi:predicted nucleotidyltransferase